MSYRTCHESWASKKSWCKARRLDWTFRILKVERYTGELGGDLQNNIKLEKQHQHLQHTKSKYKTKQWSADVWPKKKATDNKAESATFQGEPLARRRIFKWDWWHPKDKHCDFISLRMMLWVETCWNMLPHSRLKVFLQLSVFGFAMVPSFPTAGRAAREPSEWHWSFTCQWPCSRLQCVGEPPGLSDFRAII